MTHEEAVIMTFSQKVQDKKARNDNGANSPSQLMTHEEAVIMTHGFEDVVHHFVPDDVPTMYKTPRFPAWRPDKVVMDTQA